MRHSAKAAARLEKQRRAADRSARAGEDQNGASRLGQLTYWVLLAGVAAGLLWMRGGAPQVRSGTLVTAGVLLVAAVARLALPEGRAGMLGSRRRLVDVTAFAALGIGLLVAGLVFPVPA